MACSARTPPRAGSFSRDDVHFMQAMANLLATVVERASANRGRADLLAREQAARAEAESLAEVGRLISGSLDLPDVAQRIADSVLGLLAAEGATVMWLDADSGDLRVLAVAGAGLPGNPGDVAFRRGTGLSGLAVTMRRPVVSQDLLADPRFVYNPAMRELLSRTPIRSGPPPSRDRPGHRDRRPGPREQAAPVRRGGGAPGPAPLATRPRRPSGMHGFTSSFARSSRQARHCWRSASR